MLRRCWQSLTHTHTKKSQHETWMANKIFIQTHTQYWCCCVRRWTLSGTTTQIRRRRKNSSEKESNKKLSKWSSLVNSHLTVCWTYGRLHIFIYMFFLLLLVLLLSTPLQSIHFVLMIVINIMDVLVCVYE